MKKLRKADLKKFAKALIENYRVFAPVEVEGTSSFREIRSPEEIHLDSQNSRIPPKGILFPQSEVMFRYTREKGRVSSQSTEQVDKAMVLFGVRPCDVKAIGLLDFTFDGQDYKDVYFVNKRRNTIVIGLGCLSPRTTCFCTSFKIGPFSKEGSDLFLTDIGDWWLIDALTKKGEELIKKGPFEDTTDEDLRLGEKVEEKALHKITSRVELNGLKEKLDQMVESPFWESLYEKCLGCAVCTYLCPTCYCFDIQDEAVNSRGARVRNWDSCMFPLYSLETSGHNPRPTGGERWRQRLNHKFNYYVELHNQPACVGCGRCILNCPVNIDIRNVVAEALAWEQPT